MRNPKIAILILNWNNYSDTKMCLDSLNSLTYDNFQIILVDNGSNDGSDKLIRDQYSDVTFLELDNNIGFAGGNNAGIIHALEQDIPFILLLNNDTKVIRGDFLGDILQEIQKDEDIGAAGPKVYQTNGNPDQTILPYPNLRNAVLNTLGLFKMDQNRKQTVDSVAGCCVLVRTTAIKQIGLLDENFFMYGEETEWFYRMRCEGWKIIYLPVDSIIHKGASTSIRIEDKKIYIERRANVIYTLVKHQQQLQAIITALFMIILLWIRILVSKFVNRQNKKNQYPPEMMSALVTVIRQKWQIATHYEYDSG